MPTSPAQLHGAALIAPTYHITIKVLPPSSSSHYLTHIRAVDNPAEIARTREHRSFRTAANDWKHEHFTWNSSDMDRGLNIRPRIKCELEWERDKEDEETARDIRNLAEQKGERVPDKREALAMAWLARAGQMAVGRAIYEPDFGVRDEKEFLIISSRAGESVVASLFVDGKEEKKFVAKAVGENHFDAVMMLENDLVEHHRRKMRRLLEDDIRPEDTPVPDVEADVLYAIAVYTAGVEENHEIVEAEEETWFEDEMSDEDMGGEEDVSDRETMVEVEHTLNGKEESEAQKAGEEETALQDQKPKGEMAAQFSTFVGV
ncbi:hypothetical protein J4E80_001289 [Alternaria sp. BMP 0032]|nr:hypothetical protein J4E80_001289 [Alternaria sp. BMP 0032]